MSDDDTEGGRLRRVRVTRVVGYALDDESTGQRVGRSTGTCYHPEHGAVLKCTARPWMDDVKRFYARRVIGVDLVSGSVLRW